MRISLITSGSLKTTSPLSGSVSQSVDAGVDTVSSADISREILRLGAGTVSVAFINPGRLTVIGGPGDATITADSGRGRFVAGTGTLDVTGGSGRNYYVFGADAGVLKIEDFSPAKGDRLSVDGDLEPSLNVGKDGSGGTMLSFGTAGNGIDLVGVSSFDTSTIRFT